MWHNVFLLFSIILNKVLFQNCCRQKNYVGMIIHKIGFCFDSYMPSVIVKSPHHRAQQLFLSEWDLLWYTVKKYQHRESFHDIDDQGMIIDEREKSLTEGQTKNGNPCF